MSCKCLLPAIKDDPGEPIENGIVSSIVIDMADIRVRKDGSLMLDIEGGTINKIHMKRKGTYHGKRYDRAVQKFTYQ